MAAQPTADPDVTDHPDEQRYEIRIEGRLVGFAAYERAGGRTVFVHTVVEPALQGQGIGGRLAAAALDDVRRRHETAVPGCSFIADFIARHPDYRDVVAAPGAAGD